MISTSLSFDRRALRRASLALAGVATLVACDNDRALGPNAADKPATPTTAILTKAGKTGALRITILDQNNAFPSTPGALFSVGKSDGKAFPVADNGAGDTHALIGSMLIVNLQPGTYTVCQTAAPAEYVLPTPPVCQLIDVVPGTSNLGDASHLQFGVIDAPRATWVAYDGINGDSIPGFVFTGNDGSGPVAIADNSALDLDPRGGVFEVKVLNGSSYTVCPSAAPAGYAFPAVPQGCVTKPVTPGQTTSIGNMFVRHEYSAYWHVSLDGQPSKGAEFKVTQAATGTTVQVVDNGLNDMHQGMHVYVKLAAAGWYTVCMTVPPVDGALSDPSCKRIQVQLGEPGFAGDFVAKPLSW